MASVTCRLRQWGPYTSTQTLAPALGSKKRLWNHQGVIQGKLKASVLSLLLALPLFCERGSFTQLKYPPSDALYKATPDIIRNSSMTI